MACSVCCCFCLFHVFIVLRNFPLQKLNQIYISERNWVFSDSPRQSRLWGSWLGKATTLVRAGGLGTLNHYRTAAASTVWGHEVIVHLNSFIVPRQRATIVMTSLGCITLACTLAQ